MIKSQGWYSLSAKKKKLSNVTTENGLKQLTKTFEQPKRESKPSMNFKIQGKKTLFLNTTSINKKKKQPSTVHYVMKTISTNSFQK